MLNANSASTVLAGLKHLADNKNEVSSIGEKGKEWFLEFCVNRTLSNIVRIINQKQKEPAYA
jgi:hypothetical protein